MSARDWIEIGATLEVDGLEFFSGFLEDNEAFLLETKALLEKHGLEMPMMCCSPDFTEPDANLLDQQIAFEKRMIEITAFFGGRFCRVLSGQRRPGLSVEAGIRKVVQVIKDLLPFAKKHGVVLSMEEAFVRELCGFHKAIVHGTPVRNSAEEARADMQLIRDFARFAISASTATDLKREAISGQKTVRSSLI